MGRVLHIIQSLDTGGAERVVAECALAHDRGKYSPEIACVFEGGFLADALGGAGIPVHVLRRRWKFDLFALFRLTTLIARGRFDVVHTHNFSALAIGVPAAVLAGARTLVRTEHNVVSRQAGLRRILSRVAALREDAQIAVSDAVRESQVRGGRIPVLRLATVRNGISGERLAASGEGAALREELGLGGRSPVFLGVGSLTTQKNFENLLDAAVNVVREFPGARFMIAGDGPLGDSLRARADELGLNEHVLFLGRRTDVPALLGVSDVFVLPSDWEGLPITVLEAMAAGVPCVATRVGGVPEALTDGESGIVVEPGDSRALAEGMASLARDPELRKRLSRRARDVHERSFTARSMARQTEALYDLASVGRADLAAAGRIKVLFVIGQLSYGGAERQVAELAMRLPRDRYEPIVCCLSGRGPLADEIEEAGARVVSVRKRAGFGSGASRTLLALIRRERPAVVHSYLFSANWRTLLVGRLARVPLVITSVRNVDIHAVFAMNALERLLAGLNDRVIANATAVKEYVARAHGIRRDKIIVVRNGVSETRIPRGAKSAGEDESSSRPTVLIVASLTAKKDHATFLAAAADVAGRIPDARFVLVGDGPLRGDLERRCEELGMGRSVEFRGETRDIVEALAEADVCVLTSLKEGCSNFILESMFAAKPVVATDAGGNRELVDSGVTGYIVPVGDERAVASHVTELLSDETLRASMGERARERALREFTVDRMIEETVSLYEETLRERVKGLVDWAYVRAAREIGTVGGDARPGRAVPTTDWVRQEGEDATAA